MADKMADASLKSILHNVYFSLKIGFMNGYEPFPFSDSFVEFLQFKAKAMNSIYKCPLKGIHLSNLFSEACGKLKLCNNEVRISDEASDTSKRPLPKEAWTAVDCLNSFLRDCEKHEVALNAVREKEDSSETEWCAVLATHLFSQLVPSGNVTVCKGMKFQMVVCPCGCAKKIKLGNTGIGHKYVWHGFPDLMVEQTPVVIVPTQSDDDESESDDDGDDNDETTSSTKKGDTSCKDSKRLKTSSLFNAVEVKNKKQVTAMAFSMQLTSQTITNAFAQRRVTKWNGYFYPAIGCTMDELMVMFYDPDHDILLRRKSPLVLFNRNSDMMTASIIELWFILNLHFFTSKVEPGVSEHLGMSGVKSFLIERDVLRFYEKAVTEASMKQFSKESLLLNANLDCFDLELLSS